MAIDKKKIIKSVLPILVTVGAFAYIFKRIPVYEVLECLRNADLYLIGAALALSVISNIFISAVRWWLILKRLGLSIGFRETLFIKLASDPFVTILPFRSGELTKFAYLSRIKNFSYKRSILSILCGYISYIFSLLCLVLIGLFCWFLITADKGLVGAAGVVLVLAALLVGLARNAFGNSGACGRFAKKGAVIIRRYRDSLPTLPVGGGVLIASFLIALLDILTVYILALSVGLTLPLVELLVRMPAAIILGSMPVSIAGLGVREPAFILLFAKLGPPGLLLSAGILYSFVNHIFPTILGFFFTAPFLKKMV